MLRTAERSIHLPEALRAIEPLAFNLRRVWNHGPDFVVPDLGSPRNVDGRTHMRMQISAYGFDLTDELRHEVMGEIGRLVQSVDRPVNIISVQLYDERGEAVLGLDRRCRISVEFDDQVRVEDSDSEASFHDCIREAFTKLVQDGTRPH